MNEIDLTVKQIRGLLRIAPKQDIRFYLNGIKFEFDTGRVVVTDGHRLVLANVPATSSDPAHAQCIVSVDDLKTVSTGGRATDTVTVSYGDAGVTLNRGGRQVVCKPIDGKFPDYQRVIPESTDGTLAQFNPQYLADLDRCLRAMLDIGSGTFTVAHNGTAAALCGFAGSEDQAIGVCMPIRGADTLDAGAIWEKRKAA